MSSKKPGVIRRLFGFTWKLITWFRLAISNLIFLAILAFIIIALLPSEVPIMPDEAALRIAPVGMLVDQRKPLDPLAHILERGEGDETETVVRELVTSLKRARQDERVTALVLDLSHLSGGGLSKLTEVGNALQEFKTSGKPVFAISNSYSQDQYYLASYADEIFLNPMGSVLLTGYGTYRNYFKDAIDKLKLNFHVFKVGQYKDAVEPFTQNSMSEASREHNQQWLNDLWLAYQEEVESQRNLQPGSLNDYINNLPEHLAKFDGDSANLALELGLVDQLATPNQMREALNQRLGSNGDQYTAIDFEDYLSFTHRPVLPQSDKIGLLVAHGTIIDGESTPGTIGGDTLADQIRSVRKNSHIKALVVRIDSGGGSAFASELIREELDAARNAGLPVVISMGSVAASGGYWMAMASDEIWATPTTITGSIGVFSAFPTLEDTLGSLGIHTDGVGTTDLSGALRIDRPLNDHARSILQQSVDNIYQRFLNLVADARQSTPEHIHTIAQGRVWTGAAALELGLVDHLGSLEDAIDSAARRANLTQYEVIPIKKKLTPGQLLLKELLGTDTTSIASRWEIPTAWRQLLAPLINTATTLQNMNDPRGIYAQCLTCPPI